MLQRMILLVALVPSAVHASLKDEIRRLIDDVMTQLPPTKWQTMKMDGEYAIPETHLKAVLSSSKLDPFTLSGKVSVTDWPMTEGFWFRTSLKFNTKMTANFNFEDVSKHLPAMNQYSCEWTNLPLTLAGYLMIQAKSNQLGYRAAEYFEDPGFKEFFVSTKQTIRASDNTKLEVNCKKDNDACKIADTANHAIAVTFGFGINEAFTESFRKLQWKDGLTRTSSLTLEDMKTLIEQNVGKKPYTIDLTSPHYEATGSYLCKVRQPVSFDKIAVTGVKKEGEAITASFEVLKAKFKCVADKGSKGQPVQIPTLASTVKLEPDNSAPSTFAFKCASVATESKGDAAVSDNEHIATMKTALNGQLEKQACRFLVEMGAVSMSNFPALRKKAFQLVPTARESVDFYDLSRFI